MRKCVVIINGSGGVGKDTFIELVGNYMRAVSYSSVDKVKEIAKYVGWDGSKSERNRKFLSDLKLLTTDYNNMPLKAMLRRVSEFSDELNTPLLFLHVREPEEIEKIKNAIEECEFPYIDYVCTLLITRDSVPVITSNMADANVFNYEYDYIVHNDGTIEDLKDSAKVFLAEITVGCLSKRERF